MAGTTGVGALAVTPDEAAAMELEDWGPIPGSIGETVRNRGRITWSEGPIEIGVWECDAGRFRAAFDGRGEVFQVVSGRMTCAGDDGTTVEAAPGSACTFPPAGPASGTSTSRSAKSTVSSRRDSGRAR